MKQRTNASFHDFEKTTLFVGQYTGEKLIRTEDDAKDKTKKAGDVMGYIYTDGNGMAVVVGNSSTVEQVINDKDNPVEKDEVMSFEFQGKGKTKNGRDFNRFRILSFVDWNEAYKHYNIKE